MGKILGYIIAVICLWAFSGFADAGVLMPAYNGTPYFQAYRSTAATPSIGVLGKVLFDTKSFDSGGYYDNATNYRYTPLLTGKYLVHVHLGVQPTVTAGTQTANIVAIYKNGVSLTSVRQDLYISGTTAIGAIDCTAIVPMNGTTDYVEGWGECSTGSGCSFLGGTAPLGSFFEAFYLGP